MSERITLRDVVRAVFFPEVVEGEPVVRRPQRSAPAAEPQADDPTLDEQAFIAYPQPFTEEAAGFDAGRVLVLGIGTVAVLIAGFIAQLLLRAQLGLLGWLLTAVALLAWLGLLLFVFAPPDGQLLRHGPRWEGAARLLHPLTDRLDIATRVILGSCAAVFAVITFLATANNTFTTLGVIAWLLSIVFVMIVLAERSLVEQIEDLQTGLRQVSLPRINPVLVAGLLVVVLVGAGLRFYQLDAVPPEMTSDHVEKIIDSNRILNGARDVFMRGNGGRESLHFYLLAAAGALQGSPVDFTTLKVVSVIHTIALIPVIALLGRELVDWETGLYAAALLAVSWWHIMLGRLALRISLTPLVMALAAIPLIRGIRTGSRRSWLWVGVWLGVGVYSYQSMRMAPLVAIAAVAIAAAGPLIRALRRGSAAAWDVAMAVSARQTLNLVCAGLVALTIFMPMLRVWRDYPADLWNRVVNRTTSSEVTIEGSSASVFADNYVDALLMFNVSGDDGWFTGGAGDPALSEVGGLLLLLGVSAWFVRMRVRGDPADTVLVAAILVMLLPSALAVAFPVENPSLTRASGVIPFVFVLMAWPLTLIRQQWHRLIGPPAGPILAAVLIGVLLFGSAAANADTFYASYETAYRQAAPNPGEIADAVHATLGPEASVEGVWIVSWPFWQDHRAVGFELGDFAFDRVVLDAGGLSTQLAESPQRFAVRPLVFILHPDDLGSVALLRSEFPGGDLVEIPSRTPGKDFRLYVVSDR